MKGKERHDEFLFIMLSFFLILFPFRIVNFLGWFLCVFVSEIQLTFLLTINLFFRLPFLFLLNLSCKVNQ